MSLTEKSREQLITDALNERARKRREKIKLNVARLRCEKEMLFFTRYFFMVRHAIKFKVNWHHVLMADTIEKIFRGEIENLIFNTPPGSTKTEMFVINLIARGLALNPRSRFLHLSGSDQLASLNSATARDVITSDHFQAFWPMRNCRRRRLKETLERRGRRSESRRRVRNIHWWSGHGLSSGPHDRGLSGRNHY